MSKTHALPRSLALSVLVLGAGLLSATTLSAGELKVPQNKPEIVMDIPEGWTIEHVKSGFEMRSPEKNSIIVGRILGRDRKALDTWSKEAAEKLKVFGIKFDPNAKAPPKSAETAKPADTAKAEDKPTERTSAFTTDPKSFTFSGTPSLNAPGTSGSNNQVKPGENSIESLTGFGAPAVPGGAKMPKIPFHAVQYYGTTLNDKPVDVQLVIYNLPDNRLFVMMQESGSDDGRAVAMAQSVRRAK